MIDDHTAYQALKSHDSRFDGVFFVGVSSTGIYCRPICPAKTPKEENCRFFESAEGAEKAGFRPCLRCRPELAPGLAPVDHAHRIAHQIVQQMNEGLLEDGTGLEEIAAHFEISSRQLRRIVQKELGVSPIELIQTRRLLLAKQLLTETKLPVTEIAFQTGWASLGTFGRTFRDITGESPSALRRREKAARHRLDLVPHCFVSAAHRPDLKIAVSEKRRRETGGTDGPSQHEEDQHDAGSGSSRPLRPRSGRSA